MKVSFNSRVNKFQEGGAIEEQQPEMTAEAPVTQPAEETNQDPMYQILQAAAQAVQTNDCQLALQVCAALVQLAQGSAQAEQQPTGEPVYRKGGKLAYRR
jgi:hypothetical protein